MSENWIRSSRSSEVMELAATKMDTRDIRKSLLVDFEVVS
jgi:hypothetical protein